MLISIKNTFENFLIVLKVMSKLSKFHREPIKT